MTVAEMYTLGTKLILLTALITKLHAWKDYYFKCLAC